MFFWEEHGNMTLMLPTEEGRTHTHTDTHTHIYTWKGKKVAMRPIPPTARIYKEKGAFILSRRNQSDRNSRVSSFEERGNVIGDQRTRDKRHAKIT